MQKRGAKKAPTNKPQVTCGKTRTKQEFVPVQDINNIVATYHKTGFLPGNPKILQYEDVSSPQTFQESLNTVIAAKNHFEALPSIIRNRFANDPKRMLQFLADPDNREEAEKLGMVNKIEKPSETNKDAERDIHRPKDTRTDPEDHKKTKRTTDRKKDA